MSRLDNTLGHLAPGVGSCRDLGGRYNPRRGLAIYCLPVPGYTPASPGMVLGEALAARSGLGCTLLEGIPEKVPEGAVVIAQYSALKAMRPDLLEEVPEMVEQGQYAVKLGRSALVTSSSREGLASGMQTLAMLILRHTEDYLPGCVISDAPFCQHRGLAVELDSNEINANLLMQIASFAATFKCNRLHLILNGDFDPAREIPGIDTFNQACQSYGMGLGVRLRLLDGILSGRRTIIESWAAVRAAARAFGATQAAMDDACPGEDADDEAIRRVVQSVADGEVGVQNFSLDANLILRAGVSPSELRTCGASGWYRYWEDDEPPSDEMRDIPLSIDVQAPVMGFSARTAHGFLHRLDAAMGYLGRQHRRDLLVSFRDIGISHMWQNLLYPAATGLIAAWGRPKGAEEAALRYSNLLYGDSAREVMGVWDALSDAFPPGLSDTHERLVRRTAFGDWPESAEAGAVLRGIDWAEVAEGIKSSADLFRSVASGLTRNAATLVGAKLGLFALSWLHCFIALTPELDRRRREKFDADGRTETIAGELYNNFLNWQNNLKELQNDSGLEFSETAKIEAMGLRLKGLCEGIFE